MQPIRPAEFASLFLAIICLTAVSAFELNGQGRSDHSLTIHYEQESHGKLVFYAANKNAAPYQIELRFYNRDTGDEIRPVTYTVIPPNSEKFEIITFTRQPAEPAFRYSYRHFFGDPANTRHQNNHVYLLPFRHGEQYEVIQGYNGRFSHQNEYSIDFRMPEGTPVYAARGGVVIHVKDDSNRGGPDPEFRNDGNFISILHDDGTFAEYVHLRFRGSRVKAGDRVRAGDPIAYSGNTGFSTTPHLHFSVKVPVYMQYDTTPTLFRLENNSAGRLEQGRIYRSVHY